MDSHSIIGTKNKKGQVYTDPRHLFFEAPRIPSFFTGSEVIKEAIEAIQNDILSAFSIEEDQALHDELKLLDMIGFLYEISQSSPRGIDPSRRKLIKQMYARQKEDILAYAEKAGIGQAKHVLHRPHEREVAVRVVVPDPLRSVRLVRQHTEDALAVALVAVPVLAASSSTKAGAALPPSGCRRGDLGNFVEARGCNRSVHF